MVLIASWSILATSCRLESYQWAANGQCPVGDLDRPTLRIATIGAVTAPARDAGSLHAATRPRPGRPRAGRRPARRPPRSRPARTSRAASRSARAARRRTSPAGSPASARARRSSAPSGATAPGRSLVAQLRRDDVDVRAIRVAGASDRAGSASSSRRAASARSSRTGARRRGMEPEDLKRRVVRRHRADPPAGVLAARRAARLRGRARRGADARARGRGRSSPWISPRSGRC